MGCVLAYGVRWDGMGRGVMTSDIYWNFNWGGGGGGEGAG